MVYANNLELPKKAILHERLSPRLSGGGGHLKHSLEWEEIKVAASLIPAKRRKAFKMAKEKIEGNLKGKVENMSYVLEKTHSNKLQTNVKGMREKLQSIKAQYDTESETVINPLISEIELH